MLSLIDTRNRHFTAACRAIIRSLPPRRPIVLEEVARQAALSPAPHYYCTYTYALRMMRVLRHGRMPIKRDRRLAQWTELWDKCRRRMERTGEGLGTALSHVLASGGASQFFISPSTALKLAYRAF